MHHYSSEPLSQQVASRYGVGRVGFVERKENVIFLGPPGVGKTHLAISLAIAAAQSGRRVYYGTLADLITSLEEAQAAGRLGQRLKTLIFPSLLVVDEISYLPITRTGAMLFFHLMSRRYERASTVLTSNKGFEDWGDIFGDAVMASALIDRLVHHCHIVNIRGNSYRMRQHADLQHLLHLPTPPPPAAAAAARRPGRPSQLAPQSGTFSAAVDTVCHPCESGFRCPRSRSEIGVVAKAGRNTPAMGGGTMIVHLIDGTYELFRQFYGRRRANQGKDTRFGAVSGVLHSVLEMIEQGATHVGVATDHVIESFRNALWPDYKTGEGIEPALLAQFHPLEEALVALGVAVWPMIELEADDALASAAQLAAQDDRVQKVCIWTPDKDLAQCVCGDRVVQVDRRGQTILNAAAVRDKFGVAPGLIPDFLALVGDAADGYPGIPGIGAVTAARLLSDYGPIEHFPAKVLGDNRDRALLFKNLATLRTDAPLFRDVDELKWRGPSDDFVARTERLGDPRLVSRCRAISPNR